MEINNADNVRHIELQLEADKTKCGLCMINLVSELDNMNICTTCFNLKVKKLMDNPIVIGVMKRLADK